MKNSSPKNSCSAFLHLGECPYLNTNTQTAHTYTDMHPRSHTHIHTHTYTHIYTRTYMHTPRAQMQKAKSNTPARVVVLPNCRYCSSYNKWWGERIVVGKAWRTVIIFSGKKG